MNNEPVAWMAINKSTGIGYIQKDKPTRTNKMDNEYTALYEQTPVAWLAIGENTNVFFDKETALAIDENPTPLYTHPANEYKPNQTLECSFNLAGFKPPAKTLTDEEIDIETTRALNDLNGSDYQLIDVAQLIAQYLMQAILRKAQEK